MIPTIHRSSYLKLPNQFYELIHPTPIANPYLVKFNKELASFLWGKNITADNKEAISFYAGNQVPAQLTSIALAYAGHQFGYYVPLLGDGRAVVLGEICAQNKKNGIFN